MLWFKTNVIFLGVLKFLSLSSRGELERGDPHGWTAVTHPAWAKEGLWLLSRAFVLLLLTKGLMVVCTLFLSAMFHFSSFSFRQEALANVFILCHAYLSRNICANERQVNQVVFWIRAGKCKKKKKGGGCRGSEHTFWSKMLVLTLEDSCISHRCCWARDTRNQDWLWKKFGSRLRRTIFRAVNS